ncbi:MAG: Asp-tRNA(Asn)/Glu-tRNA(Gln) amidotransferase subunit GatC [Alphaproteobacteria bacterium]|nr:Asp-tRNA(Asn)/Glu-tRNA(Gln) amidotransferase subunit GatC [Alphaproteobacteria bacterium]
MFLDKTTVAKIARLARVRIPEADRDRIAGELSNILAFVEQLKEVDTKGVAPMTSVVAVSLKQRDDTVTVIGDRDGILANAPQMEHGFFVVPKVIE